MINHKWTKKKGFRYAVYYYGGEPKKQRYGGTFDTIEEAQKRMKELRPEKEFTSGK